MYEACSIVMRLADTTANSAVLWPLVALAAVAFMTAAAFAAVLLNEKGQ